ncbi:MAG: hypothetical protein JSS09_09825 [Verrucomicrobia bacterium]|nr:hypothetical protein [Verrucomicrobiota bacterium]
MITTTRYTHTEFNLYENNIFKNTLGGAILANSFAHEIALGIRRSTAPYLPACLPLSTPPHVNNAKNENNKGLIVIIHGLNSSTSLGKILYKQEIEKQAKGEFEVWIPNVPKKGNCSLEEAAKPILEMVRKYIETNPGKPVQLLGHSNGGRIAAYVETHLRDKEVNMRITGVAGAFLGSDIVTLGNALGISRFFLSQSLAKELQTGSKTSKQLVEAMRKKVTIGSRKYTFYTTVNDIAIPNFTSCLPNIMQNEECIVVWNSGHTSILLEVCEKEVKKIVDFLRKNQNIQLYPSSSNETQDLTNLAMISA